MNWRKATDQELITIIAYDGAARYSDIVEAKEELERRRRKLPKERKQYKIVEVYPK
jgi:hypothetical protein